MPKIKITKEDVTKVIMPNKCDICTIGIGKSMFYYENTWHSFEHLEKKVIPYYWSCGRVNVCSDCAEEIKKMKNPDHYIASQFIKVKLRK